MYNLDYHGDDYAVSPNNSSRMLELIDSGQLDSISIIANMSHFDECMAEFNRHWDMWAKKPLISVHINLIDGMLLSQDSAPQKRTWGSLFVSSHIPGRSRQRLKNELKEEIKAQISRVCDALCVKLPLRLDSHVHTHMIPVVFEAMTEAVDELGMKKDLEFIRNSREPLFMFFITEGIRGTFPAVNVIKNIILNMLSYRVSVYCRRNSLPQTMLWGLIMSGRMDEERVKKLSPRMHKYAKRKDRYLEILCHPGIVAASEKSDEFGPDDLNFLLSRDRDVEYQMISSLSK